MMVTFAYWHGIEYREFNLNVAPLATVESALKLFIQQQTLIEPTQLENKKYGVWNREVTLSHVLVEGDRIEIYEPLRVDPKAARQARVEKKRKLGLKQ